MDLVELIGTLESDTDLHRFRGLKQQFYRLILSDYLLYPVANQLYPIFLSKITLSGILTGVTGCDFQWAIDGITSTPFNILSGVSARSE